MKQKIHPVLGHTTFGEVVEGSIITTQDGVGMWHEWTERRKFGRKMFFLRLDTGNNWFQAGQTLETMKPLTARCTEYLLKEIGL